MVKASDREEGTNDLCYAEHILLVVSFRGQELFTFLQCNTEEHRISVLEIFDSISLLWSHNIPSPAVCAPVSPTLLTPGSNLPKLLQRCFHKGRR